MSRAGWRSASARLPPGGWHRLFLGAATLLAALVLLTALDLSMDSVRALVHFLGGEVAAGPAALSGGAALGFYLGYAILPLLAMVLLAVVALVVAWGLRDAEDASILATLFVLFGIFWGATFLFPTMTTAMAAMGLAWRPLRLPGLDLEFAVLLGVVLLVPGLLRFSVLFPARIGGVGARTGALPGWARSARDASIGWAGPLLMLLMLLGGLLMDWNGAVGYLMLASVVVVTPALGLTNLAVAGRRADAHTRRRLVVASGLVGTAAVLPILGVLGLVAFDPPLWASGLFVAVPILGVCGLVLLVVFGTGTLDARLAVRRSVLFGIVALCAVFSFGAIETAVTDYLIAFLNLPAGAGTVIAGGIMAVSFKPLHGFVEGGLTSLFGDVAEPRESAAQTGGAVS